MALLACLWELGPRLGLHLEVAAVDHGLRAGAAAELALVSERAAALGLPFHQLLVDVPAARRRGPVGAVRGGVQEVARRLRLDALAALADRRGLGRVALGHQADDQAETILFRIIRGTGLKGLAGIRHRRGPFIRPLLDVTRGQILDYLGRRSLPYLTDPSNADSRYARARIRNQVLPLLRLENPRVDRALRSLGEAAATLMTADDDLVESDAVEDVHIPVRLACEIERVATEGRGTQSFDVGGGRRVTVSYGLVSIGIEAPPRGTDLEPGRPTADATSGGAGPTTVVMNGPGSYRFGTEIQVLVREQLGPGEGRGAGGGPAEASDRNRLDRLTWSWFDGAHLSWPLLARPREAGDRMRPRGGRGSRKLSDLLIDAKVPRPQRALLPVITSVGGELLFVPYLRPAQVASPSSATARWIGLAVVSKADHHALVDPSIVRGNTGRHPFHDRLPAGPGLGGSGGRER